MMRRQFLSILLLSHFPLFYLIRKVNGENSTNYKKIDTNVANLEKENLERYIAEWELDESSTKMNSNENEIGLKFGKIPDLQHPSNRINPGSWVDPSGVWWLFGGFGSNPYANPRVKNEKNGQNEKGEKNGQNGAEFEFLSDLWKFEPNFGWSPQFLPVHENQSPISSHPINLARPLLCGSHNFVHLAVFRGWAEEKLVKNKIETRNLDEFSEDNTVWIYDRPKNNGRLEKNEEGLWTSYICCDACLPDENNTLDFCPHFSNLRNAKEDKKELQTPILWCDKNSLMALQFHNNKNSSMQSLKWWKFDLGSTEWVKLSNLDFKSQNFDIKSIFNQSCQYVSDSTTLFILCPSNKLNELNVFILISQQNEIKWIGKLHLNGVLTEPSEIILQATNLENENVTILIVAYEKIVDFWLVENSGWKIYKLENIWKGAAQLSFFQHTTFYQINFILKNSTKLTFVPNPRTHFMSFNSTAVSFRVMIKNGDIFNMPSRQTQFLIDFGKKNDDKNLVYTKDLKIIQNPPHAAALLSQKSHGKNKNSIVKITEKDLVGAHLIADEEKRNETFQKLQNETSLNASLKNSSQFKQNLYNKNKGQALKNDTNITRNLDINSKNLTQDMELVVVKRNENNKNENTSNSTIFLKNNKPSTTITNKLLILNLSKESHTMNKNSQNETTLKNSTQTQILNINSKNMPETLIVQKTQSTSNHINKTLINDPTSTDKTNLTSNVETISNSNNNTSSNDIQNSVKNVKLVKIESSKLYNTNANNLRNVNLVDIENSSTNSSKSYITKTNTSSRYEDDSVKNVELLVESISNNISNITNISTSSELVNFKISPSSGESADDDNSEDNDEDELVILEQTILSRNNLNNSNESADSESSSFSTLLFFILSLSLFSTFGLFLFVRNCVKCPANEEHLLVKEIPPVHYSVIEDEFGGTTINHTPLV